MTAQTHQVEGDTQAVPAGTGSLRTRLIVTNALIAAGAVAILGYYVYYRAQQSSASLAQQLETSVMQQAEGSLLTTSAEQASVVDDFFAEMRRAISDAGTSASSLLSQEPSLGTNLYWNAANSLGRLPNGSWDNPSTADPASVFIPASEELTDPLALELNTLKNLDFVVPGKLKENPDAVAVYFGGLSGETLYYPNIDLANVVPPDFDVTQRPWFVNAAPAQDPQRRPVWTDPYLDAALHGLVVTTSLPVYDSTDKFRGVIAMDVQLGRITDIVSGIHAGQTGYAFLVDKAGRLIAMPTAGYVDLGLAPDLYPLGTQLNATQFSGGLGDLLPKMTAGQQGLDTTFINGVERFAAYRPIPEVGYSLAIIVPSSELLSGAIAAREQLAASTASTTQASLLIVGAILLVAALAAILLGNTLTSPLVALTRTAEEITAGNLNARAPVKSRDEIGILSETLNMMTTNLRGMIQSLEQRVRDRTAALETATQEANRRAAQFEAVTRVTAAISSIRNVNELMPLVANVISEQFGYYHVGIFLNDEATQQAYLIAANSEGGRRMLSRHHGLRIGEQGIVGYVAARGEPRVARRVGEDVVFFDNPDLPSTRSEAALPLRSADRIIGVLDVQSTTEDAFNPDDLRVLAVLADQVSLAIENTRLFEMTQRSLVEAETLYRQYVRNAWSRIRADEQITGYRYSPRGVLQRVAESEARRDGGGGAGTADEAAAQLRVPIKLRDEVIGELVVRGTREGQWTQDQIDLVQAVAERVALAAENARLFDETSRRAERERLVTEITSKIRSSTDPQEMIRTAVSELRNVLGAAHVQIVPQTLPEASVEDQPGTAPEPNVTA